MGTGLTEFYNKKIRAEWKLAFKASFIIGLLTHVYKFTNTLPNHDALYNAYCDQNMINLGRWLLAPACMFSSYFDLPWLTGLVALLFISLSVVVLVEIFELDDPVAIILVAGITVSFPAVTETFFFEYTSDGYMLAMLIASYAVMRSRVEGLSVKDCVVSGACICCACGIYQAYVAYAAVLLLCYLVFVILVKDHTPKQLYKWLGKQAAVFGCGLALYYVVWKLLLKLEGIAPSDYEGIDNVGKIGTGVLISGVGKTIKEFIQFFVKWDVRKYGFNTWIVFGLLFLAVLAAGVVMAVIKSGIYKKTHMLILLILALIAIPFAAFMWFFTSPEVVYNVRMEQSLCLLYVLAVVLFDRFAGARSAGLAALLIAVCIGINILVANIYYMNIAYEKGYSTAIEVATRIHLADDGNAKDIAVIGELPGFSYDDYKKASLLGDLGPLYVVDHNLADDRILLPLFLCNYTDFTLAYYADSNEQIPVFEPVDRTAPVSGGWEIRFPYVSADEQEELERSSEVGKMSIWPARDSVKLIDDTVVVKFSEPVNDEAGR